MHVTIQVPSKGLRRANNLQGLMKIQGRDWTVGLNGRGMQKFSMEKISSGTLNTKAICETV